MDYFRPPGMDTSEQFDCYRKCQIEEQRPLKPIRKIVLMDGMDVVFRRSEEQRLTVSANDPMAIVAIETAFYDGILVIRRNRSQGAGADADSHERTVVAISLPLAPSIKVKGKSDLTLLGLVQSDLDIQVSGGGYVAAHGQIARLGAWVFGSGEVNARELQADDAVLSVSGAGYIKAHVRTKVKARVMGGGDIVIRGNPPQRERQVTGFGGIDFF